MTTPNEVETETPSRGRRFWTPRVAGVILALLLLGITEGVLRLFDAGSACCLLQPIFPSAFFPSRHDKDATGVCDSR